MDPNNVAKLVGQAETATAGTEDRLVDPRAVRIATLQDDILQLLQKAGVVDQVAGTIDAHAVVECLAVTMIPFAILGQIDEDTLVTRMRLLYRQVSVQMQMGQAPSNIIVPGRG